MDCKGESGGGVLPLILTFLFLAVLTPIGEKFLFRAVAKCTAALRADGRPAR